MTFALQAGLRDLQCHDRGWRIEETGLHQNDSDSRRGRTRGSVPALRSVGWASILLLIGNHVWADPVPSAAMLEPVQQLVAFMSTLPNGPHPAVFASHGLCIVENFAPFLFCGPTAASQWEAGFRAHSKEEKLAELAAHFDAAFDFSQSGDRAYFSLPTTWTGLTEGRHFEEHGAWSFVVTREGAAWRIVGYGWGVVGYKETAP
jgi:hypothetical protein